MWAYLRNGSLLLNLLKKKLAKNTSTMPSHAENQHPKHNICLWPLKLGFSAGKNAHLLHEGTQSCHVILFSVLLLVRKTCFPGTISTVSFYMSAYSLCLWIFWQEKDSRFESQEAPSSKTANNFKTSTITPAVTPQSDLLLDCQQLEKPDRPNGDEQDSCSSSLAV